VTDELRREVCALHAELTRNGLVAWTSGNLSARVRGEDKMVIKASGVPYDELTPDAIVVCDLNGELLEGDLSPSSDAATHGYVYRHMRDVGGVDHTHSTYATAWAARGEAIPCVLTAMADEFGGEIPVGPFALIGGEEIGEGIVETLGGHRSPAILMRSHGVFTIRTYCPWDPGPDQVDSVGHDQHAQATGPPRHRLCARHRLHRWHRAGQERRRRPGRPQPR
jgi:L-ribulose-5-phosphate 4-epimerase